MANAVDTLKAAAAIRSACLFLGPGLVIEVWNQLIFAGGLIGTEDVEVLFHLLDVVLAFLPQIFTIHLEGVNDVLELRLVTLADLFLDLE